MSRIEEEARESKLRLDWIDDKEIDGFIIIIYDIYI